MKAELSEGHLQALRLECGGSDRPICKTKKECGVQKDLSVNETRVWGSDGPICKTKQECGGSDGPICKRKQECGQIKTEGNPQE